MFEDVCYDIATDASGNVIMTGWTESSNNISSGSSVQQQYNAGHLDAFVAKFDGSGNRVWATYCGGSSNDEPWSVCTDVNENIIISGWTEGGFPVYSASQSVFGGGSGDGFVVKYNSAGNRVWASYFGGDGDDSGGGVATDGSGNIFMTGWSKSTNISTPNASQQYNAGNVDAFVAKFNGSGTRQWSTYCGGGAEESGQDIAVDGNGDLAVSGSTASNDFPTKLPYQASNAGGYDAFVVKYGSNGNKIWGTYYGGGGSDKGSAIAVSANEEFLFTGYTTSTDFPTSPYFFQQSYGGGASDAFVVRFSCSQPSITTHPSNQTVCANSSATFNASSSGTQTVYIQWQVSTNGGSTWDSLPGKTNTILTIPASSGMNGNTYRALFTNWCGSVSTNPATLTVSTVAALAGSDTSICAGASATIGRPASGGVAPYTYSWNPATGLAHPDSAMTVATPSATTPYIVSVSDVNGCLGKDTVLVTVNPLPPAALSALDSSFCAGGNVTLSVNPGAGLTYQWRRDGMPIPGANGMNYAAEESGMYRVVVTNTLSCSDSSRSIKITRKPMPPADISAMDSSLCPGGNVLLSANSGSGLSYQWRKNGIPIPGATGLKYTAVQGGMYKVVVTNSSLCSDSSRGILVTAYTAPIANAGTDGAICKGDSIQIGNTAVGGASPYGYVWTPSTGLRSAAGQTTKASPDTTTVYIVTVTDAHGCIGRDTVIIAVNPLPSALLNVNDSVLHPGDTATFTASTGAGYIYRWKKNGFTIPGAVGSRYSTTTTGAYQVVVTNPGGCKDSSSIITITDKPSVGSPKIQSSAQTETTADRPYTYTAIATGTPTPRYFLITPKAGMKMDSLSGVLTWIPSRSQRGDQSITIRAINEAGQDEQTFKVYVNVTPRITSSPNVSAAVGALYSYRVSADADPLATFALSQFEPGMSIDTASGLLRWTPSSEGIVAVVVRASNKVGDTIQSFSITVSKNASKPTAFTLSPSTEALADSLYTYDAHADGTPTPTYSLVVSPSGMSIEPSSGLVQWTPQRSQRDSNAVTVKAENTAGYIVKSFSIYVRTKPLITSMPAKTAKVAEQYRYVVVADAVPTARFALSQSPPWMNIDQISGEITGTPSIEGVFDVSVHASNSVGDTVQSFQITVLRSPNFTSSPPVEAIAEKGYSYTAVASGSPPPVLSLVNPIAGMSIDSISGRMDWTPRREQRGDNPVTILATNAAGSADQTFKIHVSVSPRMTSTPVTTANVGTLYKYQVSADAEPAVRFSLSKAPAWLTVDTTVGLISGTPSAEGEVDVTVDARNTVGDAQQSFTIVVAGTAATPVFTSTPATQAVAGRSYSYTAIASGAPSPKYGLTIFPTGMTIDSIAGVLTWIPDRTQRGPHAVTIRAYNAAGSKDQSFTIHVSAAPEIRSSAVLVGNAGEPYRYQVIADAEPKPSYSLTTAPPGMVVDTTSGMISWTPTTGQVGSHNVTAAASNPAGSTQQSFMVAVGRPRPTPQSPPNNVQIEQRFPVPLSWNAPPGGADSYRLTVSLNSTFKHIIVDTVVPRTTMNVSGLALNSVYFWRVEATVQSVSSSPSEWSAFRTASDTTFTDVTVANYPAQPRTLDYRLVSFPGKGDYAVKDLLPGSQMSDWRIWNETGTGTSLMELGPDQMLSPGIGYWLIRKDPQRFTKTVAIPAIDSLDGGYIVRLHSGWNIIGNPGSRNIDVASILPRGTGDYSSWNSGYVSSATLEPFQGYYYLNEPQVPSLHLPYPFAGTVSLSKRTMDASAVWQMRISLRDDGLEDAENFIGISAAANDGMDAMDKHKPPFFMDNAMLVFERKEWATQHPYFRTDYRRDVYDGQVWPFTVRNPHLASMNLYFDLQGTIPPQYTAVLINPNTNEVIPLRQHTEYSCIPAGEMTQLSVIVGTRTFIENITGGFRPLETRLGQNYPNPLIDFADIPFSVDRPAQVRLEIYSSLGTRIAVLIDEYLTAGRYTRPVSGALLRVTQGSQSLFYRLIVDGKTVETKKMMVLK
ncbi:MAG: putative Ig domain-containing protein [Ignavibacteria bacterium]|nr:putative Ig domain-containing protein [Ignavibacteria bacterium]